jgi:hypothetical protein
MKYVQNKRTERVFTVELTETELRFIGDLIGGTDDIERKSIHLNSSQRLTEEKFEEFNYKVTDLIAQIDEILNSK